MNTIVNTWKNKPSIIILSIVLIALIVLLLVVLIVRGVFGSGNSVADSAPPTQSLTAIAETAIVETEVADPTPTPTKVLQETTPTISPTEGTPTSVPTATKRPVTDSNGTDGTGSQTGDIQRPIVNLTQNSAFEQGFAQNGVANGWQRFSNEGAIYTFAKEAWPHAIYDGDGAQRISISQAQYTDRYAGIYQTFSVIPGQNYLLSLHGQIRSWAGDVDISEYGYRVQYAVDWTGGTNWEDIPIEEWVELPWNEQPLDSPHVQFSEYSVYLIPPTEQLTLFVRGWSKWPHPSETQYTLDAISLIGPQP